MNPMQVQTWQWWNVVRLYPQTLSERMSACVLFSNMHEIVSGVKPWQPWMDIEVNVCVCVCYIYTYIGQGSK